MEEKGSIESLSVRGVVSVSDTKDTTTGGIVGINHGTLISCQFTGVVTGDSEVGGIVGRNEAEGTIDHCTARAIVTGKSATGGITGYNLGAITGCTNVGSINTEYQEASLDTDGFTAKMVDTSTVGRPASTPPTTAAAPPPMSPPIPAASRAAPPA